MCAAGGVCVRLAEDSPVGVLQRGRVPVWARLRRGSFFSGGGDLSAKGLCALTRLVVAGAKH